MVAILPRSIPSRWLFELSWIMIARTFWFGRRCTLMRMIIVCEMLFVIFPALLQLFRLIHLLFLVFVAFLGWRVFQHPLTLRTSKILFWRSSNGFRIVVVLLFRRCLGW